MNFIFPHLFILRFKELRFMFLIIIRFICFLLLSRTGCTFLHFGIFQIISRGGLGRMVFFIYTASEIFIISAALNAA